MVKKKYDVRKTVKKMGAYLLFYCGPLILGHLLEFHPEVCSITVGTLLTGIFNWLKNKNI